MEQAWDDLVAEYPYAGIRAFRNTDPVTGEVTTTYGAWANTPQGQVVIEKPTATEAVTILSSAMLGAADDAAMASIVRRSELDQQERDAKREFDAATYRAA